MHAALRTWWTLWALLGAGCNPQNVPAPDPAPQPESTQVAAEPIASLIARAAFEEARDLLSERARAGDGHSSVTLAYVEALGLGRFQEAKKRLEALRASTPASSIDTQALQALVFLLGIEGRSAAAVKLFLEEDGTTWPPGTVDDVLGLVVTGAFGQTFEGERDACEILLTIDPDNPVALASAHRDSVLKGRFSAAREHWRRIHLLDYMGEELWQEPQRGLDSLLEEADRGEPAWDRLAIAYDARGYFDEALHCADRIPEEDRSLELEEARGHALRFLEFREEFASAWRMGLRTGFAGRGPQRALMDAQTRFARALFPDREVTLDTQIFDGLRAEYGYAFYPDWGHPIMISGALARIIDDRSIQRRVGEVEIDFERIFTGTPLLDVSWVWNPLLAAGKSAVYLPWWPDAIVQGLRPVLATVQGEWRAYLASDPDSEREVDWDLDPQAPPLTVVSAFRVGNQGRECQRRRRELALDAADLEGSDIPLERAFQRVHLKAQLDGFELHELRHLIDHREGLPLEADWSRSVSEFRAYLETLRHGQPLSQYEVLALVATGGDPANSSDPYEVANYELLEEFVRALFLHPEVAPDIDRGLNVQAQLHLLEPEEIGQLAGFMWERRFGSD